MEKKKLSLEELKVKSFISSYDAPKQLMGGAITNAQDQQCGSPKCGSPTPIVNCETILIDA